MFDKVFLKQTELVIRCLPLIERYPSFSLKGGTAINLFVRDMPRLSVDIDLTYVPFSDRETALDDIDLTLKNIAQAIKSHIPRTEVQNKTISQKVVRLSVYTDEAQIKIEPNLVLRGTVYPVEERELCQEAQNQFEMFVKASCLAEAELFAGKLCAALDRQHPRDLFDTKKLFDQKHLTPNLMEGFLFCLFSSKRPLIEILQPNFLDQESTLTNQFAGMAVESFTYTMFENERKRLLAAIHKNMTPQQKQMIISFAEGQPDWLYEDWGKYPGIAWKLQNINKLKHKNPDKYRDQITQLEKAIH